MNEKLIGVDIAKKPKLEKLDCYITYCPTCGCIFDNIFSEKKPKVCKNCGQNLDWGDEE